MSILDITNRCNLNCIYCCRGEKLADNNELTTEDIMNVVKQITSSRGTFVVLQGGEPLLKTDIENLLTQLKFLKKSKPGYYFSLLKKTIFAKLSGQKLKNAYMKGLIAQNLPLYCLTTNGMLYTDKIEEALYNAGFYLEISLDAPYKEINVKTRSGISFDKVVENINKYSQKLPTEISCTITEQNVNCLAEMIPFAIDQGCVCLKFSPVIRIGNRNDPDSLWEQQYLDVLEKIVCNYKNELEKILLKVKIYPYFLESNRGKQLYRTLLETHNILVENHSCNAFKNIKDIYIDTNLNVFGCASMKNHKDLILGNMANMQLKEIWQSEKRKILLQKMNEIRASAGKEFTCTAVAYAFNIQLGGRCYG